MFKKLKIPRYDNTNNISNTKCMIEFYHKIMNI